MITIIGLGPGDPRMLTVEARTALQHAHEVLLRTREHPTVAALPKRLKLHSFDYLYKELDEFEAIYAAIANEIVKRGKAGDVTYAVSGHPLVGETSVQMILAQARDHNLSTRIIAGLGFVDAVCSALTLDPLDHGMQVADATALASRHFPDLDPDRPAVIGQLYSRAIASGCKLTLMHLYPPEHVVTRVCAAGTDDQRIENISLAELDHAQYWTSYAKPRPRSRLSYLMTLYVPPLEHRGSINTLGEIVARLRAPDGCPWDREQTHQSLRKDFLEECYEVLETLDQEDLPHLREELGDLLLHILLQVQIASESSEFSLSQVVADISDKLVRRHPHVFGDVQVNDTDEIIANWEKIKQGENGGKNTKPSIPRALPALARAQKIARRDKVSPRVDEIADQVKKLAGPRNREQRLGQVLYALAAYAGNKHIDAESALRIAASARWSK